MKGGWNYSVWRSQFLGELWTPDMSKSLPRGCSRILLSELEIPKELEWGFRGQCDPKKALSKWLRTCARVWEACVVTSTWWWVSRNSLSGGTLSPFTTAIGCSLHKMKRQSRKLVVPGQGAASCERLTLGTGQPPDKVVPRRQRLWSLFARRAVWPQAHVVAA